MYSTQDNSNSYRLLAEQLPHSSQHTVLLWVIWMVFGRNLEHSRESVLKLVNRISNLLRDLPHILVELRSSPITCCGTYMLIDQYNTDILPLLCESIESRVDLALLSLVVAYQEVSL